MITENDAFVADTTKYITSELGEEMILMNLESGDYINLNAVSADIWKQAQAKRVTVGEIITYLLTQYEVDKDTCTAETLSCLEEMTQKELIRKVD